MGNRAVITTAENFENNGVGIYLHWNGGRDSVEPFLEYCKLKGYRAPDEDNYGWARLCQVIGNFFGGTTSIGIDTIDHLDCNNGDNGVYIIEGWKIVGREYCYGEQCEYSREEMLKAIDENQPEGERLGDYLFAKEVPYTELKVGDIVYVQRWDDTVLEVEVMAFGENRIVNGRNIKGRPFCHIVNEDRNNCNNYIYSNTIRVKG